MHSIAENDAHELATEVAALRWTVADEAARTYAGWHGRIHRLTFAPSAQNLAAYLAFRRRDIRDLQDRLTPLGLSSLGRSEGRILPALDAVLSTLAALGGTTGVPATPLAREFSLGERLLRRNTAQLFGAAPEGRETHIMVTLPEAAEQDAALVDALIARGMSVARINCAHGTHEQWRAMIVHVRAGAARLGKSCRVLMDLSGPRVRTVCAFSREDRRVLPGDVLVLRPSAPDVRPLAPPFQLQCAPDSIFERLGVGTKVSIDEGRIEARVTRTGEGGTLAEVTRTVPGGVRLKPEKGLNFPGTDLGMPALTAKDRADLDVVVAEADLIGYSFVQSEEDVDTLWQEIQRRKAHARRRPPGLILKIETARAVHNAPGLIVAASGRMPAGVMIARGDLAVEVGFERLAELQEELLWLAEAAHTPVIWATQVLDRLVRKGTPSRAEISDVVLAQRAECVMLNKGEFLLEALTIVDDVFRRMAGHQHKKTARLRALQAWS
ncbi:MAG TPA: pyruvate kinase [Polyangia bacterium]|nr:pyruvate kinase [Polyangia bacterium]